MKALFSKNLCNKFLHFIISVTFSLAFVSCVQYHEQHNVQSGGHHQVQTNYFEKKAKLKADTVKKIKEKKSRIR
jgi:hypothetical protein